MKILFFGDSITDMNRNKDESYRGIYSYGAGFPYVVASRLLSKAPEAYEIVNRGNGGNTVLELYARIKKDVWCESPDVLNILVGINDLCHESAPGYGLEIDRFEKVYRMIIEETLERLPRVKIILCEPFVLKGSMTESRFPEYEEIRNYAKVVGRLAQEYGLSFIPLQEKLDALAAKHGNECYLYDGVHPSIVGATFLAEEWLKAFEEVENEMVGNGKQA